MKMKMLSVVAQNFCIALGVITGGTLIGAPCAVAIYFAHLPLVRAYQRRRQKRLQQRFEEARNRQRAQDNGEEP